MNVDNQTIIHIKEGNVSPEQLLKLILMKKPTAVGFMTQESGGAFMQTLQEDAKNLELGTVTNFLNDAKACAKSLYFGMLKEPYDPADIQPFTVANGDDTYLGVMIEGTLMGSDDPAAHTEHHNFFYNHLLPQLLEYFNDNHGDIDKVMAKVKGNVFNNQLAMHFGHRAVLHFLPYKGQQYTTGKNIFGEGNLGKEYDWGYTSQTHGFGSTQIVSDKKPTTGFGFGAGNKAKPTLGVPKPQDVATPGTEPRASVPAVKPTEGKSARETAAVRPPSWLHKNEDIRAFYSLLGANVTSSHAKKRLPIVPEKNFDLLDINNYDDFKQYRLSKALEPTGTVTKQERMSSTAAPAPKPEDVPVLPAQPGTEPILNPKELEETLDYVTRHLDINSKEMMDPKDMQLAESTVGKFSEALGLSLEDTMNWPVSGLFGLSKKALVMGLVEWRAYARQYLQAELRAKKKDGVPTTQDTKVVNTKTDLGNGSTKTESVVVAKKSSSWGYKPKKAA